MTKTQTTQQRQRRRSVVDLVLMTTARPRQVNDASKPQEQNNNSKATTAMTTTAMTTVNKQTKQRYCLLKKIEAIKEKHNKTETILTNCVSSCTKTKLCKETKIHRRNDIKITTSDKPRQQPRNLTFTNDVETTTVRKICLEGLTNAIIEKRV